MNSHAEHLHDSVRFLREHVPQIPRTAVVLGSGLGDFADSLSNASVLDTRAIPHYPLSTIEGHRGRLVFGEIEGRKLLAFQGRIHFYECNDLDAVLYPIRVAQALGVDTLIVTNAAGGINRSFVPGDLMLITDQINLTLGHYQFPPSAGKGSPYDQTLVQKATQVAGEAGIDLKRGVYVGVKGPSYETAAEVEMIHRIGGDAVGMSTVFEVSLASSLALRVLGISCITNLATGISSVPLSHTEVTEAGNRVKGVFAELVRSICRAL